MKNILTEVFLSTIENAAQRCERKADFESIDERASKACAKIAVQEIEKGSVDFAAWTNIHNWHLYQKDKGTWLQSETQKKMTSEKLYKLYLKTKSK